MVGLPTTVYILFLTINHIIRTRLARSQRYARISQHETNRIVCPIPYLRLRGTDAFKVMRPIYENGVHNPRDGTSSTTKAMTFSIISSDTTRTNGSPPKKPCYTSGSRKIQSLTPSMSYFFILRSFCDILHPT